MNRIYLLAAAVAIALISCRQGHSDENTEAAEHEAIKFQYTAYSEKFELFAEADPFIAGEPANVLAHFSMLPDFKAVEKGRITVVLEYPGETVRQTLEKPTRKGIYSFDIKPLSPGNGQLKFEIASEEGVSEIIVPDLTVFDNPEEAHEAAGLGLISRTNTTAFTKEQSWKTDFSTGYPVVQPFGPVIRTSGLVKPAPGSEEIVTAKATGVVLFTQDAPLEGIEVTKGQTLFSITGSGFAEDNFSVRYSEAKNNYEKSKADYERSKILAEDKIISEKDLLSRWNEYENAKATYENLSKNFSASGQAVKSPINGFIKEIRVRNGEYVRAGEPVLTVSQNNTLIVNAEVPQKYAAVLGSIQSVNIRDQVANQTWTLEELGGKVLSVGKASGPDSYLLPVNLGINNSGTFIPGGIVELFLQTVTNTTALTVPNSALMEEQGSFFVWVQVTPELFEKREVQVGSTDGLRTEILDRLSVSDRIVTRGAVMIKLAQSTGALDAHSGHVH